MVIDTAIAYYHSAEDTPEKLVLPEPARVTEGLLHALAHMSEDGFARFE